MWRAVATPQLSRLSVSCVRAARVVRASEEITRACPACVARCARSSLPRVMCSALPWPRPASLLAEVVADAMLKFYWSFLGFLLGLPSFASTSPRAPSLRRAALRPLADATWPSAVARWKPKVTVVRRVGDTTVEGGQMTLANAYSHGAPLRNRYIKKLRRATSPRPPKKPARHKWLCALGHPYAYVVNVSRCIRLAQQHTSKQMRHRLSCSQRLWHPSSQWQQS